MTKIVSLALVAAFLSLNLEPARAEAPAARADKAADAKTATVFAAASLKNALEKAAAAFEKKTGAKVTISFAASLALAKQIESGAPADLFVSADAASADYLASRNLLREGTRVDLLGNSLVLVAPKAAGTKKVALEKAALSKALGKDGRIAIGNPTSVPAGKYAKAAFQQLGLWETVEPRLALTENVRAALLFVSREEAPLGVVYQTDANSDPKVVVVATFPPSSHAPIVYPIALTASSTSKAAADFAAYLESSTAASFFAKQGFSVLTQGR